jgi:hypothetical protein
MNTWYYTLIFIFSIITTGSLVYRFIVNLISDLPNKILLTDKEKLLYGISFSYLITYLIYT